MCANQSRQDFQMNVIYKIKIAYIEMRYPCSK